MSLWLDCCYVDPLILTSTASLKRYDESEATRTVNTVSSKHELKEMQNATRGFPETLLSDDSNEVIWIVSVKGAIWFAGMNRTWERAMREGERGHSRRDNMSVSSVHSCARECDKNNMWHFVSLRWYLLNGSLMEVQHCFIYLKAERCQTSETWYISNVAI